MTKQIAVQDSTYDKLQILNNKLGRNYSMNTLINNLIKNWASNTDDETYENVRLRELTNKFLLELKNENLVKVLTPEFEILVNLVLSVKLFAAEVYLKTYFGNVIRSQKRDSSKKQDSCMLKGDFT